VQWHPEHSLEDKINRAVFEIWEDWLALPNINFNVI
jgi:gamma-glutamyl-gamma-aminobutyrate hydrolase PuuD